MAAPDTAPDAPLTLRTLGGAALLSGSTPLLSAGKPFALLTYLALAPGHTATRDSLIELLWADLDPDRARHALRQTVWQLRQLLGESALTGRTDLTLTRAVTSDHARFIAAVEANSPDEAVLHYAGRFLPNFALPGCAAFEHWADIERTRLQAAFLRAAATVARRALGQGRPREAQQLARRMRDEDPLSEPAWRLLLEAMLGSNDRFQAALEADQLRRILADEDRHPEAATLRLLSDLQLDAGQPGDGRPGAPDHLYAELIGREREFASIIEAWGRASLGDGCHIHVEAAAGLGKTRLLTDIAGRLQATGARVVLLRANPGDRQTPFSFASDLAGALRDLPGLPAVSPASAQVLVGLNPTLSARFPGATARAGVESHIRAAAVLEALTVVADERPVALLVDDAHWLDTDSRLVVSGLTRRVQNRNILVVTAGRPGAGQPIAVDAATRLTLRPLDQEQVGYVLQSIGHMADGSLLAQVSGQLHSACGGSPLLIMETLRLALERETLVLTDGRWTVPDPMRLLDQIEAGRALDARLAGLDPDAAWLLLVLATAGTPLTAEELSVTLRQTEHLDAVLWNLEQRRLVRHSGNGWEPAHDELAEAALAAAGAARQRAAHRAVGRMLRRKGDRHPATALRAARHLVAAADEAAHDAFRHLVRAARRTGDRRSNLALARLVAGDDRAAEGLARGLPLRHRVGLYTSTRQTFAAAIVTGALAVVLTMAFVPARPTGGATLLALTGDPGQPGAVVLREVSVNALDWRPHVPLRSSRPRVLRDPVLARAREFFSAARHGDPLAFAVDVDNVRTTDVFIRSANQAARPFHPAARDDVTPALSPDGRSLLLATSRWSPAGHDDLDLAVGDATGADTLTRLTSGPDSDFGGQWAPGGHLIAFTRRPSDLRPTEICWVTPNGRRQRCSVPPGSVDIRLFGWLDQSRVLLAVDEAERWRLVRWDVFHDRFEPLPGTWPTTLSGRLSPDGRWAVCLCGDGLLVFPVDDPGATRPLDVQPLALGWPPGPTDALPVRIRLETQHLVVPRAAPQRVAAVIRDAADRPVAVPPASLHWTVADGDVASVDSLSGLIRGRRPGRTWIVVDLGGLARDSTLVTVAGDPEVVVLEERWEHLDSTRWLPFGEPAPRLVRSPDGSPGLNNAGDGSYSSGVVSAEAVNGAPGAGIEVVVRQTVTRSQWQQQYVGLVRDSPEFSRWDRRTGGPPASVGCTLLYPAGEGLRALQWLDLMAGRLSRRVPAGAAWHDGSPRALVIQLFPDGSCGFIIDGAFTWRSPPALPIGGPYRVLLGGNSAGTDQVLVGPATVWRGVRPDPAWTAADPPA
jgi:DNA-binding SARP family transcriptional activator